MRGRAATTRAQIACKSSRALNGSSCVPEPRELSARLAMKILRECAALAIEWARSDCLRFEKAIPILVNPARFWGNPDNARAVMEMNDGSINSKRFMAHGDGARST